MIIISLDYDREKWNRNDKVITKAVPCVILISALVGIFLAVFSHVRDIGTIFVNFCSPFVLGFAMLGVYSFAYCDRGLISGRKVMVILLTLPMIASFLLLLFTSLVMPEIVVILSEWMILPTDETVTILVLMIYFLTFLMMFTGHGVISTVTAYFRTYNARIYLSIEKIKNDDNDTRINKISRWVYDIPDIIDIERIELEPVRRGTEFPAKMFASMAFSIFALGLSVSSYIFLNPIFQSALTIEEVVIIGVILTFFIPVLVIPWFITKDIGAKIKSKARDYYIWKGMRRRLYQGFFAFTMLSSLFIISVYLGYDIVRTFMTYVGYMAITAFLSLLYAFIYSNYYYTGLVKGIVDNFRDSKN